METVPLADKEQLIRSQQEQYANSVARFILGITVVFIISATLIWLVYRDYIQFLVDAGFVFIAGVGALAYEFKYKGTDHWRRGALIMFVFLFPAVGFFGFIMPEITLAIATAFLMLLVLAYQIFGKEARWMAAALLATFIFNLFTGYVWKPQWFPELNTDIQVVAAFFFSIFLLFMCQVILDRVLLKQEDLLRQVHATRLEIENRVREEQERHRQLQETVAQYVQSMSAVAKGDLSIRIRVPENVQGDDDPLVILGRQLNDTTASLQSMTQQVHTASTELSTASAEIMAVTTQQASGASEQSAAIAQTTTTVDEVKTIAEQTAQRTQEMTSTAKHTLEVSHTGQRAVLDAIEAMNQIKQQVEGIAANILALSEQTQQIGEIIATVNDLASQSNLLALNASVEASRAGEHGRGFAVVAMEVRTLAEQSKAATAQVKGILSEIQQSTNSTVMATEEGVKCVERGVERIGLTRQSIEQLSGVIDEMAQASMQLAAGSHQQAIGVEQVSLAMRNINQATMQNLASTRQAEKAVQDLNTLAVELDRAVTLYKL